MINEIKALDGQKKRIPTMGIPHKKKKKKIILVSTRQIFYKKIFNQLSSSQPTSQTANQPINLPTNQPIGSKTKIPLSTKNN